MLGAQRRDDLGELRILRGSGLYTSHGGCGERAMSNADVTPAPGAEQGNYGKSSLNDESHP
jgi:hypothetical protein